VLEIQQWGCGMFQHGTAAAIGRFIWDENATGPIQFGIVTFGISAFVIAAMWLVGSEVKKTILAKLLPLL
jgi:hypothetical protein